MVKFAIFLWMLFFAVLAFSMMPGYMTFVVIVSAIAGVLDTNLKMNRRKRKVHLKLKF